jgi:hypothetical protein
MVAFILNWCADYCLINPNGSLTPNEWRLGEFSRFGAGREPEGSAAATENTKKGGSRAPAFVVTDSRVPRAFSDQS